MTSRFSNWVHFVRPVIYNTRNFVQAYLIPRHILSSKSTWYLLCPTWEFSKENFPDLIKKIFVKHNYAIWFINIKVFLKIKRIINTRFEMTYFFFKYTYFLFRLEPNYKTFTNQIFKIHAMFWRKIRYCKTCV